MRSPALENQNVTLSLSRQTLRKAKRVALDRGMSLSRLLSGLIEDLVAAEDRYRQAQESHLRLLDRALELGTQGRRLASREELHER